MLIQSDQLKKFEVNPFKQLSTTFRLGESLGENSSFDPSLSIYIYIYVCVCVLDRSAANILVNTQKICPLGENGKDLRGTEMQKFHQMLVHVLGHFYY